tara:strand:+ start:1817 stop:2713 length:897 start_codon:yes stop_codon:yes gene_type:complete
MKSNKKNSTIGLSRQEFELVITNSNNPELIKKHINKLDNCDLSMSAVELITEEDLAAVDRITKEVLLNYPSSSKNKKNLLLLGGTISLTILIIIILLLKVDSVFLKTKITQNSKSLIKNEPHKKKSKSALLEKEELLSSLIMDSTTIEKALSDSISKTDKRFPGLTKNKQKSKTYKKIINSNKRTITSIKLIKEIPIKYRKNKFDLDNLIDFDGGNENLKKEILKKIKIKNQQIPQKNTSIIFKFSVTPEGKVQNINIQSRINLELERIITEAILNLNTWKQGNKIIPANYTIYITYN